MYTIFRLTVHVDGLVQECSNARALETEILQLYVIDVMHINISMK